MTNQQLFGDMNFGGSGGITQHGLAVGTPVMTLTGEKLVEDLRRGDRVLTKDYGVQTLLDVGFRDADLEDKPQDAPICLPPDTFGSDRDGETLFVAPSQKVTIRHLLFDLFFGSREIIVRAADLVGHLGVSQVQKLRSITYVGLGFDRRHVVYCGNFALDLSELSPNQCLSPDQVKLACGLFQSHSHPQSTAGFPLH